MEWTALRRSALADRGSSDLHVPAHTPHGLFLRVLLVSALAVAGLSVGGVGRAEAQCVVGMGPTLSFQPSHPGTGAQGYEWDWDWSFWSPGAGWSGWMIPNFPAATTPWQVSQRFQLQGSDFRYRVRARSVRESERSEWSDWLCFHVGWEG